MISKERLERIRDEICHGMAKGLNVPVDDQDALAWPHVAPMIATCLSLSQETHDAPFPEMDVPQAK